MKKRIWAMALVVVLVLSLVPVSAAGTEDAKWVEVPGVVGGEVLFDTNKGVIKDCKVTVESAEIPAKIDGVAVTSIGSAAFEDCINLRKVEIPDSVKRIESSAFWGCKNLETIEIPDNSITALESYVFNGCESLKSFIIPNGVTSIGIGAFNECSNLTTLKIPNSVTSIESYAFAKCRKLQGEIFIPDGTEKVEDYTFWLCEKLDKIIIPDSVKIIGESAFRGCSSLTELIIPNGVISIESAAFLGCSKLSELIIPDSCSISIGISEFADCENLTYFVIPRSVKEIARDAFSDCKSLKYISIPSTVIKLGNDIFPRCENLSDIYYEGNAEMWEQLTSGVSGFPMEGVKVHYNATGPSDPGEVIPSSYELSFQTDGGTQFQAISKPSGTVIDLNSYVPQKAGYVFEGWYSDSKYSAKITSVTLNDNTTVYAKWEKAAPDEYTLTFETNGGSKINALPVTANTTVDLSKYVPTKEGYAFAGWYSNSKLTTAVTSLKLTADATVYAKWTPAQYTLTFETNGGSKITPFPVTADTAVDLTKYVPTREGYTFAGWYSDSKLTSAVTSLKLTADATVYAKWLPAQYTLTFETNGGSKITPLPVAADITVDLTKYVPTKEGYAFAGWYADRNLTTQVTALKLAADTTVYAKWLPAQYTLTFETNGGSKINALSVGAGTTVDLTQYVPVRAGYDFAGWYADRKLTTQVIFLKPTADTTVYAKWEKEAPVLLPFLDVTKSDWFYEDVAYVYENGLMNGVGEGLFGPGGTTTRAMVVTILYRLEGEPAVTGDTPFTDLVAGQYYLDAVAWASANDIVNGVTSTTFAPNAPITREQMAAILYRYAQYKGMDTTDRGNLGSFADGNTVSPYAVEALAWANAEGLVNGVESNRLNPTGQAPRSQVAAILHRFCTME